MNKYVFKVNKVVFLVSLLLMFVVSYSQSQTISGSVTWTLPTNVTENVIVPDNCTLSIESTVIRFAEYAKIIVEKGGVLILNDCKLTSLTDTGRWGGVEVRGPMRADRSDAEQGIVNANNSTISNAILGIGAGKVVGYDPTCVPDPDVPIFDTEVSGGKIIATNCTFSNNNKAIIIRSYGNLNNGSESFTNSNGSSFTECNFMVNKDVLREEFVCLSNVRNVFFYGCSFNVNISQAQLSDFGLGGMLIEEYIQYLNGIYAHNSNFKVDKLGSIRTTFDNLGYGVYVDGLVGSPSFTVRYSDFNTLRGIYNGTVNNSVLTDCNFFIPPSYTQRYEYYHYGIYLDRSTGYFLEGNVFTGLKLPPCPEFVPPYWAFKTFGVIVNSSGETNANSVYNNTFKYLEYGVSAQGINRAHSDTDNTGLCITCNEFIDVVTDINVVNGPTVYRCNGIAAIQQNGSKPASNMFSKEWAFGSHQYDLFNECRHFTYVTHFDLNPEYKLNPSMYTDDKITVIRRQNGRFDRSRDCPRRLIPGRQELAQNILNQEESINSSRMELSLSIDGGNSEELIFSINEATTDNATTIRETLLDNSPYLSTDAVKAVIENESAISNTTLRDVMVGNASVCENETIMDLLASKSNPLPAYMHNQIEVASQNLNSRDLLEANIQDGILAYNVTFANLANNYADSNDIQEWENVMSSAMIIDQQYDLAVYSKLKGETSKVNEILTDVAANIGNNERLQAEYDAYVDYINLITNDIINGNITDEELTALTLLANKETKAGLMATKLVNKHNNIRYEEPIYFPSTNMKSSIAGNISKGIKSESSALNVYPNPAKNNVIISYNAKNCSDDLMLTVTDMQGVVRHSEKLLYAEDSKYINVDNLSRGNYIVNIISEGNVVYTNKLTINK